MAAALPGSSPRLCSSSATRTSRPARSLVLQSPLALATSPSHGGEARDGASSVTALSRFASTASARSQAISTARSSLSISALLREQRPQQPREPPAARIAAALAHQRFGPRLGQPPRLLHEPRDQ